MGTVDASKPAATKSAQETSGEASESPDEARATAPQGLKRFFTPSKAPLSTAAGNGASSSDGTSGCVTSHCALSGGAVLENAVDQRAIAAPLRAPCRQRSVEADGGDCQAVPMARSSDAQATPYAEVAQDDHDPLVESMPSVVRASEGEAQGWTAMQNSSRSIALLDPIEVD